VKRKSSERPVDGDWSPANGKGVESVDNWKVGKEGKIGKGA